MSKKVVTLRCALHDNLAALCMTFFLLTPIL